MNSRVSLRGGYGLQQSPYKHDVASFNKIYTCAGGIGLNVGLFFGDLSYTRRILKTKLVFTMKMVSLPSLWLTNIRIRKSG